MFYLKSDKVQVTLRSTVSQSRTKDSDSYWVNQSVNETV